MRLHAAGNQIHLRQRAIGAAAVLHQLALADHRHEALGQRLLLRELAELERADQLIERQRSFMRGERIEDKIAARNRIRVEADRKSVGWGKSVSVRVDLGGPRLIKKKKTH